MNETLQESLNFLALQTSQSLSLLLPKILGALTALVVGVILAKNEKRMDIGTPATYAKILKSLKT